MAEELQSERERRGFERAFYQWFRDHRQDYGSLRRWALTIGVSVQAITRWQKDPHLPAGDPERGSVPNGYFMARILDLMDASYDSILEEYPPGE
jgi:hypothetical protein